MLKCRTVQAAFWKLGGANKQGVCIAEEVWDAVRCSEIVGGI